MNNNLTLKNLENVLNEIYSKKVKRSKPYTIICNSKMAKAYDITYKECCGLISPERGRLERYATIKDAYLYPKWDYLKYPQVYFDNLYRDSHINEIFEDGEEDIYGDCELIYIERK